MTVPLCATTFLLIFIRYIVFEGIYSFEHGRF